jgi:hypothetical protein
MKSDVVKLRKNRGETINLYRDGPPPRFTVLFSELMILHMMTKKCKFTTVKCILLPLNTLGNKIVVDKGNHWMLAEMHLATDEVTIYD